MPLFDLSHTELEKYQPPQTAADDFDAFWATTLDLARQHELAASQLAITPGPSPH